MRNSIATNKEERTFMNSVVQEIQNEYDDPKEIVWSRMGVFEPVEKSSHPMLRCQPIPTQRH